MDRADEAINQIIERRAFIEQLRKLTQKQMLMALLSMTGCTQVEIAEAMGISEPAVTYHKQSAAKKLM